MTETYTRSASDTYTEARARYVMGKVYDHLVNLYLIGFMTKIRADRMRSDILYLMDKKALAYFELQFKAPGYSDRALHYEVRGNSTISMDDESGGINFWGLPNSTSVTLLVSLNRSSPHITEVDKQLEAWGWGAGSALAGNHTATKSFSKDGFGLKESTIGSW